MATSVRLIDDPVLRIPCSPLSTDNGLDLIDDLLAEMNATMVAENGVGLAANQIGRSVRVFILKQGSSYDEFINPEILEASNPDKYLNEGCLSIPGVSAETTRFLTVNLRWADKQGVVHERVLKDQDAVRVQHEMDHLNGKLYVDQFGPVKRDMIVKKHKKYLKFRSR